MARPRSFDESTTIAAARDRFWSGGYGSTSLDDLTEATGLRRSSLYGAFGDKHELFLRALDRYCEEQHDGFVEALADSGPGAFERLSAHVRATADVAAENRRGCFLANATAERGAHDPDVAARAKQAYGDWESLLAGCIAQAQGEGDIDPALDPAAAALLVLGAMRGMVSLGQGGQGAAVMHDIADLTLGALRG